MDRSQMTGALLMVGAVVEALLFLYGFAKRSYLALALPIMGAVAVLSALAFWVGWTMLTAEPELPGPEAEVEEPEGL